MQTACTVYNNSLSSILHQIYLWQLQKSEEEDEVYSPHDGRTFLLVVGLDHTLVCMLMMQTELHPSGEVAPPTIDAVYVDRARSLIMELQAQDLLAECDGRYVCMCIFTCVLCEVLIS